MKDFNEVNEKMTIKEIVIKNFNTTSVLDKYNIDYLFDGNISLEVVSAKNAISLSYLKKELNKILNNKNLYADNYNEWDLPTLTNYILQNHHKYVSEAIIKIKNKVNKFEETSGNEFITEITNLFQQLSKEMENHMKKEETISFPYIKYLLSCKKFNEKPKIRRSGSIKKNLFTLENELASANYVLIKIKEIIKKYSLLNKDKIALIELNELLIEFDKDLKKHVHLENNILFPKIVKLENQLMKLR
ncbi:MAG: hemerythrin domain-containing protein [Ignavibacteriae bacterium]|nr:hemerythrin domain-containing protein [Ignavibacteriota bacterium]